MPTEHRGQHGLVHRGTTSPRMSWRGTRLTIVTPHLLKQRLTYPETKRAKIHQEWIDCLEQPLSSRLSQDTDSPSKPQAESFSLVPGAAVIHEQQSGMHFLAEDQGLGLTPINCRGERYDAHLIANWLDAQPTGMKGSHQRIPSRYIPPYR